MLNNCEQPLSNKSIKKNFKFENKYKNSGFALVYNDDLLNIKKLEERSLFIYHKSLRKKSLVKISNPKNGISLIAEVKSNKIDFSNFYNSILSPRIAKTLDLDLSEPYVEISLVSKESTFISKKTKTFDEEKNVAEKVPVDGIQINDLNEKKKPKKISKSDFFNYSIKVADFYYEDTATIMFDKIKKEISVNKLKIIKLSPTKFRLLIGPFDDIKSLKNSFEIMNKFNFENLEVLRNV